MVFTLVLLTFQAFGQEMDTTKYRIETSDGNIFIGTITISTDTHLQMMTDRYGEITLRQEDIRKKEVIHDSMIVQGKVWFENPQATRYFWAPNSFTIQRGEGYYQNVWVFVNQFVIGFTDNVSFGAGLVPMFLFGESTPVWFTPRVSFPLAKNFSLGSGALIGTVAGETDTSFGIVFFTSTIGDKNQNLSFNLGWGYSDGDFAETPTFGLNVLLRLGPKGYFITENYLINDGIDNYFLLMAGGRSIVKRMSVEYGLLHPGESGVVLPWLGLTVPFSRKKN